MHRYRRPAILAVAAFAVIALVGAARHLPASASTARATGTAALATNTGAPYLRFTGPAGGDVRLANLAGDLRAEQAFEAAQQQAAQAAAAQQAQVRSSQAAGSSTGHACGGDLPPCCVMMRESRGSTTAMNPSGAAGKWQFMPGTWNGYGGYSSAAQAPESVQDAKARQVWAGGAGAGNWGGGC
jgi:hypothetical protein